MRLLLFFLIINFFLTSSCFAKTKSRINTLIKRETVEVIEGRVGISLAQVYRAIAKNNKEDITKLLVYGYKKGMKPIDHYAQGVVSNLKRSCERLVTGLKDCMDGSDKFLTGLEPLRDIYKSKTKKENIKKKVYFSSVVFFHEVNAKYNEKILNKIKVRCSKTSNQQECLYNKTNEFYLVYDLTQDLARFSYFNAYPEKGKVDKKLKEKIKKFKYLAHY